ncbi:response regulator transcription factor [Streptomyces griseofuscus]|uniref:DNA-binding response regulator n=1 Tax=Streptomyces griseofuscus TaxID=146922 RepID=A0A3R8QLD7_9ACTN|nr:MULTISPECIES: response regulator transcription factor [Streptomyces]MBJ6999584.1 response regulator transcription factor [Streptomyces sp. CRPSP2-6A1]MYQ94987.1 response regulator [Streptomyces sp. SID4946]MYR87446.1 response regulator [Streptomyces sp. SID685]RRQ88673.1 DNA-binding response regulator [Streptomyces griseofuscus]
MHVAIQRDSGGLTLTIRVLLAEDMHMVRGALVALLEMEEDIDVIAELANGDEIVPTALEHRPDVAVLDIDLAGMDGLTAAAQLRDVLPECRTLILTSLGRPGTFRRALAAGARGFILKDAPPRQLAQAIRQVSQGERVVDPDLMVAAWDSGDNPLTERETEVLRLAAGGAEVAEIAGRLYLSVGTVRNYLTSTSVKLNARNRLDAVRIAREAGWL